MLSVPGWTGLRDVRRREAAVPPGPRPVGLIACAGRFPIAFAEKARECGVPVVCVGVAGMADPALKRICTEYHTLNRASLGFLLRTFRRGGVEHVRRASDDRHPGPVVGQALRRREAHATATAHDDGCRTGESEIHRAT